MIDDFKAGFDANEHLILKGCKTTVHFSWSNHLEICRNRFEVYKVKLTKQHLGFYEELVFSSRLMEEDGIDNIAKMLALPYQVDSVFSANDVAAISAM